MIEYNVNKLTLKLKVYSMITRKSQYKHNSMKYSDYIKLIGYLNENCTDKNYHVAMTKLDKFKIIQE